MVRKVTVMLAIVALLCAIGTGAHAASYEVYDGNPSNTYIQYFRDIASGLALKDNYVAFRSGQYEYTMIVGVLTYDGERFNLESDGSCYTIAFDSSYNSNIIYSVEEIDSATITVNNRILYSDIGQYPELIDRGAKYEILTAILVGVALLGVVVRGFFRHR